MKKRTTGFRLADKLMTGLWLTVTLFGVQVRADSASFTDLAEVVEVAPISETVNVPVRRESCATEYEAAADPRGAGNVRELQPHATLADAIDEDLDALGRNVATVRCRWKTEYVTREEPLGYRVTYEYQGQQYTRVLDDDPGSTIRIRVALDPED